MSHAPAYAKVNLALVVGQLRADGKHEVATVLQRVSLHDDVDVTPADRLTVHGFADDTLVRAAFEALATVAGVAPSWSARIDKRIPVAAGLAGGSSDAASALLLANASLESPLPADELHRIAACLGADVPFFLRAGSQLATGDGSELEPLELPTDYVVVLALPHGAVKSSTADVYRAFDERGGGEGFDERREALAAALRCLRGPRDLAALPANDLASSPLAGELEQLGAFRADVSGAGPIVYGLFATRPEAESAASIVQARARTWVTRPIRDDRRGNL